MNPSGPCAGAVRAAGTAMTVDELRTAIEHLPGDSRISIAAALWGHTEVLVAEASAHELLLHVDATNTVDLFTPLSWGQSRPGHAPGLDTHPGADRWSTEVLTQGLGARAGATDLDGVVLGLLNDLEEAGYRITRSKSKAQPSRATLAVPA